MKKAIPMTALTALLASFVGSQAMAADATVAVDVNSAYVWRGLTFNDGVVVQPSVDVATGGFDLNVWGNLDVGDYDDTLDSGEFSEVDLTASYAWDMGPVGASVGVIEYLFPAGGASTTELFATAGMDLGAGLSSSLELYYDIDQVEDYYATVSVGYARDFNEKAGMELGVLVGYAGKDFAMAYAGGTDSGWFNYTLSAAVSYAVTEALSTGVSVNYTDSLSDDVLPDGSVDSDFYGGLSVAYSF